jgi:hypothetical protein
LTALEFSPSSHQPSKREYGLLWGKISPLNTMQTHTQPFLVVEPLYEAHVLLQRITNLCIRTARLLEKMHNRQTGWVVVIMEERHFAE